MNWNDGEGSNVEMELRKRLAKCETDSARLDWLATECTMTQLSKIWMHSDPNPKAFRKAIDAARAAREEE